MTIHVAKNQNQIKITNYKDEKHPRAILGQRLIREAARTHNNRPTFLHKKIKCINMYQSLL